METDDGTVIPKPIYIITLVLISLTIIITIYILFLYIKSKEFHTYSCAYVIILIISILLTNIIRVIQVSDNPKYLWLQQIQAFFLTSLDKYILLALTLHVFIIYMGVMKTDFYYNNEKKIFLITFLPSFAICFLIGGLYLLGGVHDYGIYYYAEESPGKFIVDNIFNSIFLLLNSFFCIVLIINICKRKQDIEKHELNNNNYEHDLNRVIIIFVINTIIYVETFLIINIDVGKNNGVYIDFVYLITCFIINLIYTINKLVINETKKIFCKKIISEKNKKNNALPRSTYFQVEMKNRLINDYDDDN